MKAFFCYGENFFNSWSDPPYWEIGIEIDIPFVPPLGMAFRLTDNQKKKLISAASDYVIKTGKSDYPFHYIGDDMDLPLEVESLWFDFEKGMLIIGGTY